MVKTAIFIDDEAAGGLPSELSAFEDLGLMGGAKKKIEAQATQLNQMQKSFEELRNKKMVYCQ